LTGDACQIDICFYGLMVPFSSCNAHVDFKVVDVDRPFYNGSDLIKGYLFFKVPLEAGKQFENPCFHRYKWCALFGQ